MLSVSAQVQRIETFVRVNPYAGQIADAQRIADDHLSQSHFG